MKRALILGINGGFGGHVAKELQHQGWALRALMRNPDKLPHELATTEVIEGDANDIDAVRQAANGVDLIVYGLNVPYHLWENQVIPLLNVSAQVAEELELLLLFPGNVYLFDPDDGPEFSEDSPINPPTRKGELRQQMEMRLERASREGAKVIIIRAGDFIGEHAPSTWMGQLIKSTAGKVTLQAPGPRDLIHTWSYLPDVARTAVTLVERAADLPAFNRFHFPGYRITFNELATALGQASGKPVKLKSFPWWILRLTAPFVPLLSSLIEMRYLWQREVNLDGKRLEQVLGQKIEVTPLSQALKECNLV